MAEIEDKTKTPWWEHPEQRWKLYQETRGSDGSYYLLQCFPGGILIGPQAAPFLNPHVDWILGELQKPAQKRIVSKLEAGLARFDGNGKLTIVKDLLKSGKFEAARFALQGEDLRFEAMTPGMWNDLKSILHPVVAPANPLTTSPRKYDILKKHIYKPSDFKDRAKVAALFKKLDAAGITLPKLRKGGKERKGTYSALRKGIRYNAVIECLRRSLYPRKPQNRKEQL